MDKKKIIVGITGGSGSILAIRLLENLVGNDVHLIISENAKKVLLEETDYSLSDLTSLANHVYDDSDIAAKVSSGSFRFSSFVIIPCSTSTLAKVSAGIADTLITRVASVAMKERRRMIVVPRETPLSTITLENMTKLSRMGIVVTPAMPGYYTRPKSVDDMVNFVVSRVLDLMDVENELINRWRS